ncbi:mechanosensitive ion channel family protein [Algoriphagus pacificus]|uniref:Mechanosensitive ion channel n=1 Tax=Algoriphagus pacificus TaxID=2811234 RepID=A0ABS3CFG6_9BACT|nr:mechanosensitive ion channel domain-containing protein [Algoriphagus pacificus]MBN7815261.1 mechanosensitive ion channel [Algoriphagus pacificus]
MNRTVFTCLFCLFLGIQVFAQEATSQADSTATQPESSLNLLDSLFVPVDTVVKKRKENVGTLLNRVINKAQQHAIELNEIKLKLSEDLDTVEMSKELPLIRQLAIQIQEKAIEEKEVINLRYLKGIENLITAINEENNKYDKIIKNRVNALNEVGNTLEEIKNDSLFNLSLRDTTIVPVINAELNTLRKNLKNVDSTFLSQEIILAKFQARIGENAISLMELQQFLALNQNILEKKSWEKEINYPWEPSSFEKKRLVSDVFTESSLLNISLFSLYVKRNVTTTIVLILLFIGLYFKLKSIVKAISNEKEFASLILDRVKYFRRFTFVSSLIFIIPFYLIIYHRPPLVFVSILSLILVIASTFIIKAQFGKFFYKLWLIFMTPYLVIAISGLQWKIAYQERWLVLLCSVGFVIMGVLILKDLRLKNFNGSTFLKAAAIFLIAIELFSTVMNVIGRFNLSKTYAVAGAVNFYRAVGLYLFVQVVMEAIYLIVEQSKAETDGFTSYFDFQDLQKRMRGFLIFFAVGIWTYGLIWHLGFFDHIFDWLSDFLFTERTLGNTQFQFGSILLFIIILFISAFLANNIAYFASMKDQKTALSRKQRLGSSVLLIRLGVLILGFFIGATAAKIPLDSIAIVLGALSVGIGFGLQTIINNLVSGIILAFERPIQIGDEIEVGSNSGTVKEVGIRASKILAYDGSEVVIPNGDLLSQSLINWTLSDKRRRIELIIGVGYGSDMKKVKTIIEGVLSRDRILKAPQPKVFMQNFGDNSVDFRVLFWVESMDIWIEMRSEVMTAIFEEFSSNDIEIPFPKRDLYIKSLPERWKEKVTGPGQDPSSDQTQDS